jgi:hypothetical protein
MITLGRYATRACGRPAPGGLGYDNYTELDNLSLVVTERSLYIAFEAGRTVVLVAVNGEDLLFKEAFYSEFDYLKLSLRRQR